MQISDVYIKGFRNFKDTRVSLSQKALIFGSNDIGKSNFLYAIRILLDKSLSMADLEPKESDFYAFEDTQTLSITIAFTDVIEECVIAKFRQFISDQGNLCLSYKAFRDRRTYELSVGPQLDQMTQLDTQNRFYLPVLNVKFIGTKRDLINYIRTEKRNLLQDGKLDRSSNEVKQDDGLLEEIERSLTQINQKVRALSYVQKATQGINEELEKLSFHHTTQNVIFDTGASTPSRFVDDLKLASQAEGSEINLEIGGDGRNSQIHLALWATRNQPPQDSEPTSIQIFAIEEPETHLHPHQQRRLAHYLFKNLNTQVIITTHSPQIAASFPPKSLIRFCPTHTGTIAACNGINPRLDEAFLDFAFRLNVLSAEAFFSNVVLLVEGPSEEIFYKTLASQIGIDLDRLNISILAVNGVGFEVYVALLEALSIKFVIRTDNDIFRIPRKMPLTMKHAGIERTKALYQAYIRPILDNELKEKTDKALDDFEPFSSFREGEFSAQHHEACDAVRQTLADLNLFVADVDLETDLHNALPDPTAKLFQTAIGEETIKAMKSEKATSMFRFALLHGTSLASLRDHLLAYPLLRCQELAK